MFKFDFNLNVDDLEEQKPWHTGPAVSEKQRAPTEAETSPSEPIPLKTFREIPLVDLLDALPDVISYSPLSIPLSSEREVVLARRDLFDARFQLISEPSEKREQDQTHESSRNWDTQSDLTFLEAPSDLVPGVYEGGLKTWECSVDLAACLHHIYGSELCSSLQGKRILELGCGTAIPSLYILHELFSSPSIGAEEIHLHMQDYNDLVFRLVTVANVILVWYMTPASAAFRERQHQSNTNEEQALPSADPSIPSELPITPELKAAFLSSLRNHRIHLRFFSGSWETFDIDTTGGKYDLVLTSETIYNTASLPSLVDLMRRACTAGASVTDDSLAQLASTQLSIAPSAVVRSLRDRAYLCLVAAKLVYFGVGGGVAEFLRTVESESRVKRGTVATVWERQEGVKRSIMAVTW